LASFVTGFGFVMHVICVVYSPVIPAGANDDLSIVEDPALSGYSGSDMSFEDRAFDGDWR
jgi:hypothetical protein